MYFNDNLDQRHKIYLHESSTCIFKDRKIWQSDKRLHKCYRIYLGVWKIRRKFRFTFQGTPPKSKCIQIKKTIQGRLRRYHKGIINLPKRFFSPNTQKITRIFYRTYIKSCQNFKRVEWKISKVRKTRSRIENKFSLGRRSRSCGKRYYQINCRSWNERINWKIGDWETRVEGKNWKWKELEKISERDWRDQGFGG